jgi:hypothetical protein
VGDISSVACVVVVAPAVVVVALFFGRFAFFTVVRLTSVAPAPSSRRGPSSSSPIDFRFFFPACPIVSKAEPNDAVVALSACEGKSANERERVRTRIRRRGDRVHAD